VRKILFVDDQQEPLFYHKMVLQNAGYKVLWFRSPDETAAYLEKIAVQDLPDLVILDINMPPDGRYANDRHNLDGLRTGIILFKDVCASLAKQSLKLPPFIVLTQLQNPTILNEVRQTLKGTPVLDKFETSPSALLNIVKESLP